MWCTTQWGAPRVRRSLTQSTVRMRGSDTVAPDADRGGSGRGADGDGEAGRVGGGDLPGAQGRMPQRDHGDHRRGHRGPVADGKGCVPGGSEWQVRSPQTVGGSGGDKVGQLPAVLHVAAGMNELI